MKGYSDFWLGFMWPVVAVIFSAVMLINVYIDRKESKQEWKKIYFQGGCLAGLDAYQERKYPDCETLGCIADKILKEYEDQINWGE
jgi:hypothetical protein